MDLKNQQMFNYMLMQMQQPCVLTIGGVVPLNWTTAHQVIQFQHIISTEQSIFFKKSFILSNNRSFSHRFKLFKSIYVWINLLYSLQ